MRLIDADALIEILAVMQGRCNTKAELIHNSKIWQQVKDMPTVDAVPVVHGYWIDTGKSDDAGNSFYMCSVCGCGDYHYPIVEVPYCWKCGARMDEVKEK